VEYHNSMIYSIFIFVGKILTDYNLNYLWQTTGSILYIDHTYKFTKYLGVYQKSIELSKASIWIIYSIKVLILLNFSKFLSIVHFK
jgi:hypothetical protein